MKFSMEKTEHQTKLLADGKLVGFVIGDSMREVLPEFVRQSKAYHRAREFAEDVARFGCKLGCHHDEYPFGNVMLPNGKVVDWWIAIQMVLDDALPKPKPKPKVKLPERLGRAKIAAGVADCFRWCETYITFAQMRAILNALPEDTFGLPEMLAYLEAKPEDRG
jgi:hypothetical protein